MKIVFFIGGLSGGGAERVVCNLANYLSKKHDVELLTMSDDEPTYKIDYKIKRIVLLNRGERRFFLYNTILRFCRLCKYLVNKRPQVYVVMLPITTILLLTLSVLTKSKIIAAERSFPSIYKRYIQKMLKIAAHKADGWVFQNETQYNWYSKCRIKKSILISNAINPSFIKSPFIGERSKYIVTVGSLSKPKNHELLISAFAKISKKFPDYRLKIYGKGIKLDKLKKLSIELGVERKIIFQGYSKHIGEEIYDAALFVLSSDYEGMPNALMEAMALGLPCISTDCDGGGAKLLINSENNGLLVPKGDMDALANAMVRMLSNKDFAEQCSREANTICKKLAPEIVYEKWESFIKEIVQCD